MTPLSRGRDRQGVGEPHGAGVLVEVLWVEHRPGAGDVAEGLVDGDRGIAGWAGVAGIVTRRQGHGVDPVANYQARVIAAVPAHPAGAARHPGRERSDRRAVGVVDGQVDVAGLVGRVAEADRVRATVTVRAEGRHRARAVGRGNDDVVEGGRDGIHDERPGPAAVGIAPGIADGELPAVGPVGHRGSADDPRPGRVERIAGAGLRRQDGAVEGLEASRPGRALRDPTGQAVGVAAPVAVGREGTVAVVARPDRRRGAVARDQVGRRHPARCRAVERRDREDRSPVRRDRVGPLGQTQLRAQGQRRCRGTSGGERRIGVDGRSVDCHRRRARDLEVGRVGAGVRVGRSGDGVSRRVEVTGDRAPVAAGAAVGVHLGSRPGRPAGREREGVVVVGRRVVEDLVDGLVRREQLADVPGGPEMAFRDDRCGASLEPAGGHVVHAGLGLGERGLGLARLGVPRRVAQVMEEDDRVGCELDLLGQVVLAVILGGAVSATGLGVEPETVLRVRPGGRPVWAWEAVAVAHVDHDRRALHGLLRRRPGRVRGVDLDHVRGVFASLGVGRVSVALVVARRGGDRPDDDRHLRLGSRRGRGGHREAGGDEQGEGDRRCDPSSVGHERSLGAEHEPVDGDFVRGP